MAAFKSIPALALQKYINENNLNVPGVDLDRFTKKYGIVCSGGLPVFPFPADDLIKKINEFLEYEKRLNEFPADRLENSENQTKTEKQSRSINGYSKKGVKLGRPNKEITRKQIVNECLRTKTADTFLLVDNSPPDVVNNNELYIECLNETVDIVKKQFFADNPDLVKKHPSIWFRNLCNTIKKNIPRIDFDNYSLLSDIWDIYSNICLQVGINRTIENFQIFTGFNYNLGEKLQKQSNPTAIQLAKKIYSQCRSDLVGGLSTSFGSSPNQMFIAKSVYGLTENTVVTHVSAKENTLIADDIPLFIAEND